MFASTIVAKDEARGQRPTCALLTDAGLYWPLTQYFRSRNFSLASERAYASSVSKLMNWTHAKRPSLPSAGQENHAVFNSFLHDLLCGTMRGEEDDTGLWWPPATSATTRRSASHIAEFSDWLSTVEPHAQINPGDRDASAFERLRAIRAFRIKKRGALLAHTMSSEEAGRSASRTRAVAAPGRANPTEARVVAFPENRIEELLWTGFENEAHKGDPRPWKRWNLRDILITLICLYGGTRQSEPLHLWVDDVFEDPLDPTSCKLLIHAPEDGVYDCESPITGKPMRMTRAQYLKERCGGKVPLTMETGRRRAGWKNVAITERDRNAFRVFWINPEAGRLFRACWEMYVLRVRPPMPNTPWAFLTKDGQPLGARAYADSFHSAVEKIGMVSSKWGAGTPHSLRHRYGQWLNELGIDEKTGQICMHHRHRSSQDVYRAVASERVAETLASAAAGAALLKVDSWKERLHEAQ